MTTAVAVGAFCATIAADAAVSPDAAKPGPPTRVLATAKAVAPELKSKFALFRSDQTPATARVARDTQADPVANERGVNLALARKALTTADGDAVLASPTADGACLGTSKFGIITCADVQALVDGESVGAIICSPSLPKDKVAVFGLVPDGVTTVAGELSDGTVRRYAVVNNAFAILADKRAPLPEYFTYGLEGGEVRTPSSIPTGDLTC